MNWLYNIHWRRRSCRGHAIRILATAAILLGAPPAWTQNEGASTPNPENALTASPVASFLTRFSRPPTAEAAPRTSQKHRVRASRPKPPVVAQVPEAVAPAAEAAPPEPQPADWPVAHENLGAAGIVPVEIRTVREVVEAQAETAPVAEDELSDLDLSARPISRLADKIPDTDGRGTDEAERRDSRFAAFAENLQAAGAISWIEPLLLMLAGAVAALTAMRVFARG